jgi:argininosuccinate lyase
MTPDFNDYTVSTHYDQRLYAQDIEGSIAHARMLAKQEIITSEDCKKIVDGLLAIQTEINATEFVWDPSLEDLHMNIEKRLFELIGSAAGRLHTGRSRNDQISTDVRLYIKGIITAVISGIRDVQNSLVEVGSKYSKVIMPGYTHLQRAQPVLFAHHMLAYFHMLERDVGRFSDCCVRADVLPLGSGALAGVPYPTDRDFLAAELGFAAVTENSMDAVSDRDFLIEFHSASSILMMHISRLSEEIILWSSREFGFITIDDQFTTGSSIMPQKRNPDFAELARGKTGRVYGNLMGILTVLKGLPLTYNRDLQEDKEGLFDTVDTIISTLRVYRDMMASLKLNEERVSSLSSESYMLATDLADYLVSRGVPFREAHGVMRELCKYCEDNDVDLQSLSLDVYKQFSTSFEESVYKITAESSINARDIQGGTAPDRVAEGLEKARRILRFVE